jgi:hypothetical protein
MSVLLASEKGLCSMELISWSSNNQTDTLLDIAYMWNYSRNLNYPSVYWWLYLPTIRLSVICVWLSLFQCIPRPFFNTKWQLNSCGKVKWIPKPSVGNVPLLIRNTDLYVVLSLHGFNITSVMTYSSVAQPFYTRGTLNIVEESWRHTNPILHIVGGRRWFMALIGRDNFL